MFPTPMHPMVIRLDGAAAPKTEDGTIVGIAKAAPAAGAALPQKLSAIDVPVARYAHVTHTMAPRCCLARSTLPTMYPGFLLPLCASRNADSSHPSL